MPPVLTFDLLIDECIISLNDIHVFIPDPTDRHCGICYNDYYDSSMPANKYSQANGPNKIEKKKVNKLRKIKSRFPAWCNTSSINDSIKSNDASAADDDGRIEIPIFLPCGHHMGLDCLLKLNPANSHRNTREENNNKCPFCRHQLFAKGSNRPGWRPERPRQSARSTSSHPNRGRHQVNTDATRAARGDEELTEQQALLAMAKHLLVWQPASSYHVCVMGSSLSSGIWQTI